MRETIKGHVYDTNTAEYICNTHSIQGTLYRKYRSNKYFLLSRNGLHIEPIRWKEAREIARCNAPRYLYLRYFTSQNQEEGSTSISITRSDLNKLKAIAGSRELSNALALHSLISEAYRKLDRHQVEP